MMVQQFIAPSLSISIGNYMLSSVIWVLLHEEMDRELHEMKPGAISECNYTHITLKSISSYMRSGDMTTFLCHLFRPPWLHS